jgi:hypothetical protein
MRIFPATAILLAVPSLLAASSNQMSVATFLERSDALQRRGALAAISPDAKLLQREAQASFEDWVRQARPPVACPPKGKTFRGDPQRFLAMLRAVPPAQRSQISVREVFRRDWNRRWPCR